MRSYTAAALLLSPCDAFVFSTAPQRAPQRFSRSHASMNFFEKLMQEMDNFADDAMGRRLGNGAKFYGKRRSSFYGEEDTLRKADPQQADSEEDYAGPAGGSYFVLSEERDEQGRPLGFLTRKQAREAAARKEEERYQSKTLTDNFAAAMQEKQEEFDA